MTSLKIGLEEGKVSLDGGADDCVDQFIVFFRVCDYGR